MTRFEQLLCENKRAVERFVKFKIANVADADDILQEVYFTAFKNFAQLKNEASFKAWIIGIAKNKCNDYYRIKFQENVISIDNLNELRISDNNSMYGKIESKELFESLDNKDKDILYLAYFKGLQQLEIAKRLGLPIGTVKSRLYTAKQNLKTKYGLLVERTEIAMTKLPKTLPEYNIELDPRSPFDVKWEETLLSMFIVPKLNQKQCWGAYDKKTRNCLEWAEMEVVGKAEIHGIECVEIKEIRHNHFGIGKDDKDHFYYVQLTDTHVSMLAENYEKDGVRKIMTFLDGDDFVAEWGYGEDNCGREINLFAKGNIVELDGKLQAIQTEQLTDIVGRYKVTISGKTYDTVRVINLSSYYGEHIAIEQYLDQNGRTILWRRFNRDDWNIKQYGQKWSEQLPDNEQLNINGDPYVHWYDCITDYIL